MQEWLVSANMEVDDEVHAEFEAEDPHADYEVPHLEAKEPLEQEHEPQSKEAKKPLAPEDEPQAEAEDPLLQPVQMPSTEKARSSTTPKAGPSTTTLLTKLAQKVDKLESNIRAMLVNQQYIIYLLNNIQ